MSDLTEQQSDAFDRFHTGRDAARPLLHGVSIQSANGLRGITDLYVPFEYPLTAIAGRNGSGKSTVLALAALAFHSPPGHVVPGTLLRRGADRTWYTFRDFFIRGPGDAEHVGTEVSWIYKGSSREGDRLTVTRGKKQWMHYHRRPERRVYYVPMSRCVPASERSVLRSYFGSSKPKLMMPGVRLDRRHTKYLGKVLGRDYSQAEDIRAFGHALRRCETDSAYTSFNMGAGEDVLIELLALLQAAEPGSLVVIEEVELGLHPSALTMLARVLDDIARRSQLQIVCTTHSEAFLDALPSPARLLLQRSSQGHSVHRSPSTEVCVTDLAGERQSELVVLCEDDVAYAIVEAALPMAIRRRITLISVGSDSNLATGGLSLVTGADRRVLLLWDGDVRAKSPEDIWLAPAFEQHRVSLDRIGYDYLPGTTPPEGWLWRQLETSEGPACLATQLRATESEALDLINAARAGTWKGSVGRMARLLGRDEGEVLRDIVASVAQFAADPLAPVRSSVLRALDGEIVRPDFPTGEPEEVSVA